MKFLRPTLLTVLLLSAATASATSTRVLSLGGGGDAFEDVDNVGRWFGSLPGYADLMLVELGRYTDPGGFGREGTVDRQAIGAHLALGENARWGVAGLYLANDDPQSDVRALWGLRRGAVSVGLHYRYGTDAWTAPYLQQIRDSEVGAYGLGLRWEVGRRTVMDVAGELIRRRTSWYRELQGSLDPGMNHDSYAWRLRAFHELSAGVVVVPWFSVEHDEGLDGMGEIWYWEPVSDLFESYRELSSGGLALNLLPDGDTFVVASVTVSQLYQDHGTPFPGEGGAPAYHEVDRLNVRLRVGAERRVLGWLTVRAGAWKDMNTTDVSTPLVDLRGLKGDDMDLSVGLGVHLGRFDLDAVFADDAPFNVGSVLTNAGESASSTWARMSVLFLF